MGLVGVRYVNSLSMYVRRTELMVYYDLYVVVLQIGGNNPSEGSYRPFLDDFSDLIMHIRDYFTHPTKGTHNCTGQYKLYYFVISNLP
jgi:hypothetical protein